ncbi:MAG: hypothetical protein C4547_04070 [Phycisphaerales bacterium]|nr:MAG: hypothetical protein C4547_04070 [Phycisphaerales bacterium]
MNSGGSKLVNKSMHGRHHRKRARALTRRTPATCLAIAALSASCDRLPTPVVYLGGGEFEPSPSGRAVALVDWRFYHAILGAPATSSPVLDGVVHELRARFPTRPDAVVFVLDFENYLITLSRLMHERGFKWMEDLENLSEAELSRYGEALEEVFTIADALPFPPGAAFNRRYRQLETGTGSVPERLCPACPSDLRGYVFVPRREELAAGRFMHEFAHFWAARLHGPPVLETQVGDYAGHWGFTSVHGLLGGWDPETFEEVGGGGVYRADVAPAGRQQNVRPYAPLELYLMGLAPPEEVSPIRVAVNVTRRERLDGGRDQFAAERIDTVTIEDIIAANGPRVPAYPDAPTTFELMLVVLTDHSLSDDEWDFYERSIDFLEAGAEVELRDVFPTESYPGHHEIWEDFAEFVGSRYVNFNASTTGRGWLRFRSE